MKNDTISIGDLILVKEERHWFTYCQHGSDARWLTIPKGSIVTVSDITKRSNYKPMICVMLGADTFKLRAVCFQVERFYEMYISKTDEH